MLDVGCMILCRHTQVVEDRMRNRELERRAMRSLDMLSRKTTKIQAYSFWKTVAFHFTMTSPTISSHRPMSATAVVLGELMGAHSLGSEAQKHDVRFEVQRSVSVVRLWVDAGWLGHDTKR